MKVSFLNNITLKNGQLLNAGPKHCSSFNCMKSLKMFILTPKTSNNIFTQCSAGYHSPKKTLHENCSYSELFWSVFSRIRTAYGEILCGKIRTRLTPNTETFYAEFSFQYLPKCPKRPNFKYIFSFIFLLKTFFRPEQLHPEVHYWNSSDQFTDFGWHV